MTNNVSKLIESFQRTHWLIQKQAEGLSHADSLLQLPFRSNCFNWVLGHIAQNRERVLTLLDEKPALTTEEAERYRRGSDPVTQPEQAVTLERLLGVLNEGLGRIAAALEKISPERLSAIQDEERQLTLFDQIDFLHWHETYHVGQLEILRQLAGTNDAVIS